MSRGSSPQKLNVQKKFMEEVMEKLEKSEPVVRQSFGDTKPVKFEKKEKVIEVGKSEAVKMLKARYGL